MSFAIFDNDTFFETLQRFYEKFKDIDLIQGENNKYQFKIEKENIEFGKTFLLSISENESELFTFSMTHYDEEQFKAQVKQPFMWDSSARENFEKTSFIDFLGEKDLFEPYQISVIHEGIVLKGEDMYGENQEEKIHELLRPKENNFNFQEIVTSALYNENNLKTKNQLKQ